MKLIPLAAFGSALAGIARALTACTQEVVQPDRSHPTSTVPPTPDSTTLPPQDDEYVPTTNAPPPVIANEVAPRVPVQAWEARFKQLEADQSRLFGAAVFSAQAPGQFATKVKSHVPQLTVETDGDLKKVTVLVAHPMGSNQLDSGTPPPADSGTTTKSDASASDASSDAAKSDAAPADAAVTTNPGEHYITTMIIRALVNGQDTVVGLWEFASSDPAPPSVKFTLPVGVTQVIGYEWCTWHGLWKSDPLPV